MTDVLFYNAQEKRWAVLTALSRAPRIMIDGSSHLREVLAESRAPLLLEARYNLQDPQDRTARVGVVVHTLITPEPASLVANLHIRAEPGLGCPYVCLNTYPTEPGVAMGTFPMFHLGEVFGWFAAEVRLDSEGLPENLIRLSNNFQEHQPESVMASKVVLKTFPEVHPDIIFRSSDPRPPALNLEL